MESLSDQHLKERKLMASARYLILNDSTTDEKSLKIQSMKQVFLLGFSSFQKFMNY